MKKILLVLGLFATIFLVGCSNQSKEAKTNDVTYEQYQQKLDDGDTFYLLITKESCSGCQKFKKLLGTPADNFYQVDVQDTNVKNTWIGFIDKNDIKQVPALFLIKDKKVLPIDGEGKFQELYDNYQDSVKNEKE